MAFDFINQAIDKVVGAGKAVKDAITDTGKATKEAVVKADTAYQDFMNTKVAPKATKVGEVAVDTANLIIKPTKALITGVAKDIGAKASYNAGYITEAEKNKRYQEASDTMVEGLDGAISKWASSLNQNILQPTAQTIKDASGGASILGSVIDTTGDVIQSAGKNIGVGKVRDSVSSGTEKIATAINSKEDIGTRLLEGAVGATDIGLGALMSIPVANLISGVVSGANDESGVTKKLQEAEGTIVQKLVDSGMSEKNAANTFHGVMNTASLIFGAKGAKSATKMGRSGATEAKIQSVLPTATKTTVSVLKDTSIPLSQRIASLPEAIKQTRNARALGEDVIKANQKTINESVSKNLTKVDLAKNALMQSAATAGYATAPDTIQLGVASVLGDNQNNQDEGNKISAGDALTYTAGALLGAKPSGGRKPKASSSIEEAPTKVIKADETINTPVKEVTPVADTYNLKTKKSAYNFITNQKRFDEKGIVYKASTSDGKEVYGNLDIHNKKMVLRIPNSNEVYSVTSINKIDSTPIKISDIPETIATPTPEPTPTPDVNQTLISLVDTYKGDGKTKGKIGSIQVDFGNELSKALYSVRESKNKLKPKDESALQELARLSGLDEAQIRKLGEDVATKIKDKIYREKAVTPEGVKISSSKDDGIIPKEDDILGLNEPLAPKGKEKVVSPLTQRYQELIANNAKEGDALSRAKGIFELGKTFDKIAANIDRIASTKTLLNNFRVGEGKELAGNYTESKQARDYSQLNSANIDEFNIADRVKESAIIPKRPLKEADLVGATTPEGLVLDDKFAKEAYDTYRLDGDKVVERAVPLIAKGVSSKDIKQSIESTYIYDVFKNNPEKLNEFFTPEQINILQKQYADNAAIQSEMAKSGQDIGVIPDYIDTESGYLRKVTTARAAERAGKMKGTDDGKIEVTLSDGTVMKVDTMEEALRLSALKRDSSSLDPENMSSLTKKQAGPEYDPFRVHGSTASLLSLNDAVSKLYADKNAIKFIDGIIEKGDPNYTGAMKTKAYNLMAKDILGIRGTANKAEYDPAIRGLTKFGVRGAMLANIANATTNIIPSIVRNGIRSAFDLGSTIVSRGMKEGVSGATKAIKDAKISQIMKSVGDERVDARLRGLGAINEFNIDNASPYSQLEGKLMYITNGTWAEIPNSKVAATLSMANSLNRAGRLEGAKDANDVIDRWEAWQKEGGQDFYEARGALDDSLRSLGKTGSTDKMNIPFVPSSINDALGALKSWSVGQAAANKEAINTIARGAYENVFNKSKSYSNRQIEDSVKDLGARWATYATTGLIIKEGLKAAGVISDDDDKEVVDQIVRSLTTRLVPDPVQPYLWSVYNSAKSGSAVTGNVANTVKGTYQLLGAIGNAIAGDNKEAQAYLRDSLANYGKIGAIKTPSDIIGAFNKGDSLQDIVANKFGTFSKEEASASGISSGKNWNSFSDRMAKLFGMNTEQAKNDALYAIKNGLDAPDWVKKVPYGPIMFNAVKQEMRPVLDYLNDQQTNSASSGSDIDKSVRAGYAYDVVKDLHNSKDANEFFQKNGFEGIEPGIVQLVGKLIESNISQNKNVDPRFTQLVQGLSRDTFIQDMEKVRQLDPYLYNNIVSTFGELKEIKDQAGTISPEALNNTAIDRIKNKTNSISQEDYAISQANDDYALTTSFTNAIGNDIAKVTKDLQDSDPKAAKEKMDNLEKLSAVMNSPSIYQYKIPFANLIANNATSIYKAFTDLGADKDSYPFLKNALLFGAQVVRGATMPKQPEAPTSVTPTPLSGTTLRGLIGSKPISVDKPATVSNITIDKPLKVGQLKIDPLLVKLPTSQQGASLNNQTLSSMVKRKTPKL